ncbi:MAG: hypothetical protein KKE37_12315 [Verrucomicrobia bacterium]|nr:hypothetical protein [Verrucomicrobiota bacterium]MBU4430121.1 hypothetical protein [Verrucomicrobiota bacterium]MCG2680350.1 hypothetical protein [Kiritimatiellia bacterium]
MLSIRKEEGRLLVEGDAYQLVFQKERGDVDLALLSNGGGFVPVSLPGAGFHFGAAPFFTRSLKPAITVDAGEKWVRVSEGFDFGTDPTFYHAVTYHCLSDRFYIASQYFVSPGAPLRNWPVYHLPPKMLDTLLRAGPSFQAPDSLFTRYQFRDGKGELCEGRIAGERGSTYGVPTSGGQKGATTGSFDRDLPYLGFFSDGLGAGLTFVYVDYGPVWTPGSWFVPPRGHFLQNSGKGRAVIHSGLANGYLNQPWRMAILLGKDRGPALEKRVHGVLKSDELKRIQLIKPADFKMRLSSSLPGASDSREYIAYGVHTGLAGWGWWIPWYKKCLPKQLGPYLDMFSKYPGAYYNLELSPDSFRDALKNKKGLAHLRKIREMVANGKAEVVGATFAQPFNDMCSGESNVRHLQLGIKYTREATGANVAAYYTDEPGICAQLPQLLKSMGYRYAVLRGVTGAFGRYPVIPKETFQWEGLDGSLIESTGTTQNTSGGELGYSPTTIYERLSRLAKQGVGKHLATGLFDLVEPAEQFPPSRLETLMASPQVEFTTISGFFEKAGEARDKVALHPDSYLVWEFWGFEQSGLSHLAGRRAENRILVAESLAGLAKILGGRTEELALEEAWSDLLISQHHDISVGAGWPKRKGLKYALAADRRGSCIIARSIAFLKRRIEKGGKGRSLLVFNALPWPRRAFIEADVSREAKGTGVVSQGEAIPVSRKAGKLAFSAELPAFGYRTFSLSTEKAPEKADVGVLKGSLRDGSIENEFYRLRIGSSGLILSVYDKELGREMLARPGNELTGYRTDKGVWVSSRKSKGRIELVDQSPAAMAIRAGGLLGDIPYVTEIRLVSGIKRIDITTTLDYGKGVLFGKDRPLAEPWDTTGKRFSFSTPYTRFKLKANFQPDLVAPRCYREIPFGATQCKPLKDWTQAGMIYYADMTHGVTWAELSDGQYGFTILNKGRMGYHRTKESLSLILGAGDRRYPLQGKHVEEYALYTHSGTYEKENLVRVSQEYNLPTPATWIGGCPGEQDDAFSLFRLEDTSHFVVSAVMSQGEDLLVRLVETAGRGGKTRLNFLVPLKGARSIELDGRILSNIPMEQNGIEVELGKWQVRTIRIRLSRKARRACKR